MKIDQLVISTQARNSWKSFDLGCRMAMTWWRQLYGFLLVVTFPVFVLCQLVSVEFGIFILWWCKPLFERGLLYIFSRQVFGQQISASNAIKAWPSQLKLNWFQSITWRRFSPSRGFDLAVTQLEQLTGEKRASRLAVLHRTADNNNAWWLIICVHWELFILMGLFVLMDMLVPSGVEFDFFKVLSSETLAIELGTNLFTYLAILLIAPIYIGGSFAAYLNRRIILEGWDIELSFKKIQQNSLQKFASVIVMVFTLGLSFNMPETAAQQSDETLQTPSNTEFEQAALLAPEAESIERHVEINQNLQEVLQAPPFNQNEMVRTWRWTGWQWESKSDEQPDLSVFATIFAFIAKFLEVILWVVFISLLLWLLWLSRFRLASLANIKLPTKTLIDMPSFGQHRTHKDLPKDIPSELRLLMSQQAYRQALSLMLVSSLMNLQVRKLISLNKAMTEQQCLTAINRSLEGESKLFMVELINTWIQLAWAHRWPQPEKMQALFVTWIQLYATPTTKSDV